jgi:hypothetical protein
MEGSVLKLGYYRQHRQIPGKPIIRPDLARCRAAIKFCEDDPEKLMFLALNAVQLVYYRKADGPAERREQLAFDRITMAYLALGKLLGIGEDAEGLVS